MSCECTFRGSRGKFLVEPSTTWGHNDLSKSWPVHMRVHWPCGKKLPLDFPPVDVLGSMRRQRTHSTLAENLMLWNSQQIKSTPQLALHWQSDNRFPSVPIEHKICPFLRSSVCNQKQIPCSYFYFPTHYMRYIFLHDSSQKLITWVNWYCGNKGQKMNT